MSLPYIARGPYSFGHFEMFGDVHRRPLYSQPSGADCYGVGARRPVWTFYGCRCRRMPRRYRRVLGCWQVGEAPAALDRPPSFPQSPLCCVTRTRKIAVIE